jgi:nicotinate dehydrogenase subunit B
MALWNGLFHHATPWNDDPTRSAIWNRGAYLVNHVGNCGGCHTPRNVLGAEQLTEHHLRGTFTDGWEAPALDAFNRAPIAWTEGEFYSYLRQGHSIQHGAAAGPMASVVRAMTPAPDSDIRAIAHYLASLQDSSHSPRQEQTSDLIARAAQGAPLPGAAQRQFEGSCGGCHYDGSSNHLLGQNLPLALNTNLYSDRPDNLIRIILDGIQSPASVDSGFMPGFRGIMTDRQLTELLQWMRQRFAPGQRPWENLAQSVARVRVESANQLTNSTGELARKPPL